MQDFAIIAAVVITLGFLARQQWALIQRNRVIRRRYYEHMRRSRQRL